MPATYLERNITMECWLLVLSGLLYYNGLLDTYLEHVIAYIIL